MVATDRCPVTCRVPISYSGAAQEAQPAGCSSGRKLSISTAGGHNSLS